MKKHGFSLTFAILSSLASLLVLTWLLLSIISFTTAQKDLLAQKIDESRLLLSTVIGALPDDPRVLADDTRFQRVAGTVGRDRSFAGLLIVARNGEPVASRGRTPGVDSRIIETLESGKENYAFSEDGTVLHRYAPFRSRGEIAGAVRLSLSLGNEQARLKKSRHVYVAYFILDFLLLLGFGYFILNRVIVAPVRRLRHAAERVTAGDYLGTVPVPGCREIAEVAESFNTMVAALNAKREEVDSHVRSLELANRELQSAREETIRSEKMASIGLLAAGMAHEVGTPLSAIIGYAGILRDEIVDDPEKADYIGRIESEACRIDRIVRSLLHYARPSESERETVRPGDVVNTVLDLLTAQGALKNVTVLLDLNDDVPPVVVDRHELQQVLINLVLNARDAMPDGGTLSVATCAKEVGLLKSSLTSAPSSIVRGRRREDFNNAFVSAVPEDGGIATWVVIVVSDTGGGIPAEYLGKVFDPFFTTKEPGHGTGLGLSICARIIDSFGGRIVAESEPGKGATFTILLPAATHPIPQEGRTP